MYSEMLLEIERSGTMLLGMMDYKNSLAKKILNQDKVDPGTFSFLEPGWWALHATTITAAIMLGSMLSKRARNNM